MPKVFRLSVFTLGVDISYKHDSVPFPNPRRRKMKKTFSLRVVLSVVTGRLLTEPKGPRDNGIGDLYEILNHMTEDNLFTHQLPRANKECKPWLLRWFPELANANTHLPRLDRALEVLSDNPIQAIDNWLYLCKADWGMKSEYEIDHIPRDDHDVIDPIDELTQMRGTDEGTFIVEL